jgi:hypothetical protein
LSADDTCDDWSGESVVPAPERAEEIEAWRSFVALGAEVAALVVGDAALESADEADVSAEAALDDTEDELEDFDELLPQPASRSRETAAVEVAARALVRMDVPFIDETLARAYRAREAIHLRSAP